MTFALDEDEPSKPPTVKEADVPSKVCKSCNKLKSENDFRLYGKGRRGVCMDCEDELPVKKTSKRIRTKIVEEEEEDLLEVSPSHGFSVSKREDLIHINQNRMDIKDKEFYVHTIILSKNELMELIIWAKDNRVYVD